MVMPTSIEKYIRQAEARLRKPTPSSYLQHELEDWFKDQLDKPYKLSQREAKWMGYELPEKLADYGIGGEGFVPEIRYEDYQKWLEGQVGLKSYWAPSEALLTKQAEWEEVSKAIEPYYKTEEDEYDVEAIFEAIQRGELTEETLIKAFEKGAEIYKAATTPLEVPTFDITIPETLIAEGWTVTDEGLLKSPQGELFSAEDLETKRLEDLAEWGKEVVPQLPARLQQVWDVGTTEEFFKAYEEELGIAEAREAEVMEAFKGVFPTFPEPNIQAMRTKLDTDKKFQDEFLDAIQGIGRTPETEALLKVMGADESQINEIYGAETGFFIPQEMIKEYSSGKTELPTSPEIEKQKNLWNTFYGSLRKGIFQTTQALNKLMSAWPVLPLSTPEEIEGVKTIRRIFAQNYTKGKVKFDDWVRKHPELEPPAEIKEFKEQAGQLPFLDQLGEYIKNPMAAAYTVAEMAPPTLAALTAFAGVTALTGNPVIGGVASFATFAPMQVEDVAQDLISAGATEDKAYQLAIPVGVLISALDIVGEIPILKALSPALKGFEKGLQKELVNRTMVALIKRGLVTFSAEEFTETLTEVAQQIIQDYTVSFFDKNRDVFANINQTAVQTLIGVAPFAIFGGAVSMTTMRNGKPAKLTDLYGEKVDAYRKANLPTQEQKLQALNDMAKLPEGEAAIKKAYDSLTETGKTPFAELPAKPTVAPVPAVTTPVPAKVGITSEVTRWVNIPENIRGKLDTKIAMLPEQVRPAIRKIEINPADEEFMGINEPDAYVSPRTGEMVFNSLDAARSDDIFFHEVFHAWQVANPRVFDTLRTEAEKVLPRKILMGENLAQLFSKYMRGVLGTDTAEYIFMNEHFPKPVTPEVTGVKEVTRAAKAGEITKDEFITRMLDENAFVKKGAKWFKPDASGRLQEATAWAESLKKEFSNTYDKMIGPQVAPRPLGEEGITMVGKGKEVMPTPEAGMPEAGLQPSMLPEEVAGKEVRPRGKGRIVQISMEEQLKLEEMRREAEIEGLKDSLEVDPVANFKITETFTRKTKQPDGTYKLTQSTRQVGLESFISIREQEFPEYFTVKQAQAIRPHGDFTKWTEKGLNIYNKVPKDVVLDDLTKRFNMTPDEIADRVMAIRNERARIKELEREVSGVSLLLDTPPETTLPMPDDVNVSEDRVVRPPVPPEVPPPAEPPTIHPPQPVPIEDNRLVMPDLQPPQQVLDIYSRPDFWRNVANLPLVKKLIGLFNPAAVANDPAKQALILRAVLKDEAAQKAQAVMSHLWQLGTQDRIWGKTDENGLLTSEPFVGTSVDDIRTYPSQFERYMTAEQKEWVKRADEVERAKLDALKRNEIEINELSFEDGGVYAGRRVMGKFNDSGELIESGRVGVSGRVGAKQPFEKTRIFKTAFDGITAGYRYMNSDEALYYNTIGAYNRIADKQMSEWILTKVDWRTTAAPETLVLQAESARLRLHKAQQLLAALNRAVRGERVPSNTINSIATVYVDQADTLKNLIPELQKTAPETAEIVQTLTNEAKALIAQAKLEYAQAVDQRARAREEAQRVKYEEASIAHPAFQGKIFTGPEAKEIADTLRKGLQPQFIEALGAVNKVNAIGRFFMLAGDASPMTIQLQFLAFFRPKAYAKAMGGFVRAMFDPEFQYRYYANNRDLLNRHPNLILSGRGTEFTEFMGRGGLGKKLGILAKPLVPFQKAFEGSLDVAGIELAKSLDHRCTNPQNTMEVDQFINEFRGLTSSARIGVSSTQRQVETASLLAPRYNRAIAGYLFDIVHGGLRGSLARMSLAQGLAGISAMAVAISIALGEDEDEIWQHFDPTSNKFFTWDVMGVKIGLGGKVRSVLKMFGNMVRTGEVGEQALRFLRGNLSPGASTSLDLITGRNYIGEPTRDNVLHFTETVGRNFMMIWTQNFLLEGGTLKDKAIIATAEFLGLRGYDISAKKEMKIKELEELLGQQIGKTPVLSKQKPDIYQGNNFYSDIKKLLQYITSEEVLADKGYAPFGHAVTRIEQSEGNTLPDIRLQDYNFDKTKGNILSDYMNQWAERQRIIEAGERARYTRVKIVEGKEERTEFKGLEALNAHKVDYPNAERGNVTRRQRELLLEYNAAVDKKQFIKDNPDIVVNPKTEWLKSHPRENAESAMFGQAKLLTMEAYNEFNKLLKEWDWPDAAIPPQTLPPNDKVAHSNFDYLQAVQDFGASSAEAMLARAKDGKFNEWYGFKSMPEQPVRYYELKAKNRNEREYWERLGDKEYPETYMPSDTKEQQDAKRAKFLEQFPKSEYFDDENRCEAIAKKFPDEQIEAWVERGKQASEYGGNSPQVKVWAFENMDAYRYALSQYLIDDEGALPDGERNPLYKPWSYDAEKLKANYTVEEAYYKTLSEKDSPDYIEDIDERWAEFGKEYPKSTYRIDLAKIEAFDKFFAKQDVDLWAEREQIAIDSGSGSSAEVKVFFFDHPDLHAKAKEAGLLKSDMVDWNESALRIDVRWRNEDAEYQAILDKYSGRPPEEIKEAKEYLAANEEYRKDSLRRDAYKLTNPNTAYKFPIEMVEDYVIYSEYGTKGKRQERMLLEGYDPATKTYSPFAQAMRDSGKLTDLPEKVPDVAFDDIYDQFKNQFELSDAYKDLNSPDFKSNQESDRNKRTGRTPRQQADWDLRHNPDGTLNDFGIAEYKRQGYELYVPNEFINRYTDWKVLNHYSVPKDWPEGENWYGDDWYLIEHPAFYENIYLTHFGLEERDFSKVPGRDVWRKYLDYLALPKGQKRHDFRSANLDLDKWGVLNEKWKPVMEVPRPKLTARERAEEKIREEEEKLKRPK